MNDGNNLFLEGRLTRDPEVKTVGTNKVANFSIATNRYFKRGDEKQTEVSFFEVESWGKEAERIEEFAKKGTQVRIFGRLKQNRWTDKDGRTQSQVVVFAPNVVVVSKVSHVPGQPEGSEPEDED